MTPTVYNGQPSVRAAFSNWRTTDVDLEPVHRAITAAIGRRGAHPNIYRVCRG
jgi:hypothetical protein